MDEATARTKWCPFTRMGILLDPPEGAVVAMPEQAQPAFNRVMFADNQTKPAQLIGPCVASACMAWQSTSDTDGYCGLATERAK